MSTTIYKSYFKTLREHWFIYGAGILALLITSATEVLIPKFIQWATDLLISGSIPTFFSGNSKAESLDTLMFFFVGTLLIAWMGRVGWRQLLARRTHDAGHDLKVDFWDALRFQPLSFLHRYSLGDLMNRATGDWNKSRFIHGFTMVLSFDVIFFAALSLISMLLIDVQLTLACLAIVPFLPRNIIRLSKKEYYLHQDAQEKLSLLSDQISQAINTIRLQRATATSKVWERNLGDKASTYADKQFKVLETGWKLFLMGAIPTLFAYLVLFTFGLYKYHRGDISLGEFLAMQSYVLLLQSPLFELGSVISEWQTGFASYGRLRAILDKVKRPIKGESLNEAKADHGIEIENLTYRYGEKVCIDRLNLTIKPGEKIGFIGPIGSGKTTLVHIIAGLLPDFEGSIKILGTPLEDINRHHLTSQLSVVPQKPFLFAGTIRHNLCLDQQYSEDDLITTLKNVRLWADVEQMSKGLDTWIGEWGINLSGGQKQRLAIARALLRPSQILILDDCLSAVDSVTEKHILDQIQSHSKNTTIIWTAHRASSLALCDRVFQMNKGQIHLL